MNCEQPTAQMRNQTGFRCTTLSKDFHLENLSTKCVPYKSLIRCIELTNHSIGFEKVQLQMGIDLQRSVDSIKHKRYSLISSVTFVRKGKFT